MTNTETPASHKLTEPIEAVGISDEGEALVAMVDFPAGEEITIEQQADAGDTGIFGWEDRTIAYYRSRGWRNDTETVFWKNGQRYITLNLPRWDT